MVGEGRGPLMHARARVGVLSALNRNVERVFNPDRKEHNWGKRNIEPARRSKKTARRRFFESANQARRSRCPPCFRR
jgi:hypothetical protein